MTKHHIHTPGFPDKKIILNPLVTLTFLGTPIFRAKKNIFSRGKFGTWKYEAGNMDHCFMQGVEVVDRIVKGKKEITVWEPSKANGARSIFILI